MDRSDTYIYTHFGGDFDARYLCVLGENSGAASNFPPVTLKWLFAMKSVESGSIGASGALPHQPHCALVLLSSYLQPDHRVPLVAVSLLCLALGVAFVELNRGWE